MAPLGLAKTAKVVFGSFRYLGPPNVNALRCWRQQSWPDTSGPCHIISIIVAGGQRIEGWRCGARRIRRRQDAACMNCGWRRLKPGTLSNAGVRASGNIGSGRQVIVRSTVKWYWARTRTSRVCRYGGCIGKLRQTLWPPNTACKKLGSGGLASCKIPGVLLCQTTGYEICTRLVGLQHCRQSVQQVIKRTLLLGRHTTVESSWRHLS